MDHNRAAVIIPVYNHEKKVADVIRKAMSLLLPIYVVDDGSTDSTYERIKDMEEKFVRILHEEIPVAEQAI